MPKKGTVASTHVSPQVARLAALRLLAPADEYFGQLKLSILGIKNTIKDLGLRYDVNHDIAKQTISSAALAEGAIRDWEHKYPRDREVPRAMYFLQRLYSHIVDDQARLKAKATASWLFADYPAAPQTKVLKKLLATETASPAPAPAASAGAPGPGQPAVQPGAPVPANLAAPKPVPAST